MKYSYNEVELRIVALKLKDQVTAYPYGLVQDIEQVILKDMREIIDENYDALSAGGRASFNLMVGGYYIAVDSYPAKGYPEYTHRPEHAVCVTFLLSPTHFFIKEAEELYGTELKTHKVINVVDDDDNNESTDNEGTDNEGTDNESLD